MAKILIVDDDPTNIFALSAVLRSKGWEIVAANGADRGMKELSSASNGIGLVLLDMMMPETDGYEMIRQIRNDDGLRQLPIISVTAQAMKGDREKCIEAGADDYISKPIDVERLLVLLDRHIK